MEALAPTSGHDVEEGDVNNVDNDDDDDSVYTVDEVMTMEEIERAVYLRIVEGITD